MALLALLIAGCGASAASAGGNPGATPTATATRHPGRGLTVRPCPGPWGSAMHPGSGVVILTPSTPNRSASAQVGQTVEVQLPAQDRWSYNASASTSAGLSLVQPGGIEDGQLDLCVWNFTAQSAGFATLAFTGAPLCDPNVPCPAYAILQTFTVTIR